MFTLNHANLKAVRLARLFYPVFSFDMHFNPRFLPHGGLHTQSIHKRLHHRKFHVAVFHFRPLGIKELHGLLNVLNAYAIVDDFNFVRSFVHLHANALRGQRIATPDKLSAAHDNHVNI